MDEGFEKGQADYLPKIDGLMAAHYLSTNSDFVAAEMRGIIMERLARDSYGNDAIGYVQVKSVGDVCTVKCRITPEHRTVWSNFIMDYISGWCKSDRRLQGMTAIVTGCNTGIGRETALDFYLRGGNVIMACRDVNKAIKAKIEIETQHAHTEDKGSLVVQKLDISSMSSVREFATMMLAEEQEIHILVNNAGVMMAPQGTSEGGFETHMATNHFGHALLTLMLLPKLARSCHARVVFVSSMVHEQINFEDINYERTPYDPLQAYCRSKVANVLFARALSQQLQKHNISNISTYSLHPGVISTGIGRHFSDTYLAGATWVFNNILYWFLKSPRCGAQTTIYCALDDQCAAESGLYYSDCAVKFPSKYAQRDDVAAELWELTIAALKLREDDLFT